MTFDDALERYWSRSNISRWSARHPRRLRLVHHITSRIGHGHRLVLVYPGALLGGDRRAHCNLHQDRPGGRRLRVATLIRTTIIFGVLGDFVDATGKCLNPFKLSGLVAGASRVCYFCAPKIGEASKAAPVDKLSVLLVSVFAVAFGGIGPHCASGSGSRWSAPACSCWRSSNSGPTLPLTLAASCATCWQLPAPSAWIRCRLRGLDSPSGLPETIACTTADFFVIRYIPDRFVSMPVRPRRRSKPTR